MNQHVPCTEFSDLDKIAKSARDARVWLEEDKQRYTPGFDSHGKPRVIDESPGLFKDPNPEDAMPFLQLETRFAILRYQGIARILHIMRIKGLFNSLSDETFCAYWEVAMREQAMPLLRKLQKSAYENNPLSATALASIIYATNGDNGNAARKRFKENYLEPLEALRLVKYRMIGVHFEFGMGDVLDLYTDEIYTPLAQKIVNLTCQSQSKAN